MDSIAKQLKHTSTKVLLVINNAYIKIINIKNENMENEILYAIIELSPLTNKSPKQVKYGIALSGLYPPFSIAFINSFVPPIASNVTKIFPINLGRHNIANITAEPAKTP